MRTENHGCSKVQRCQIELGTEAAICLREEKGVELDGLSRSGQPGLDRKVGWERGEIPPERELRINPKYQDREYQTNENNPSLRADLGHDELDKMQGTKGTPKSQSLCVKLIHQKTGKVS